MGVFCPQRIERDPIVEDRLDNCVFWDEFILEHYLVHWVIEASNTELANLKTLNVVNNMSLVEKIAKTWLNI